MSEIPGEPKIKDMDSYLLGCTLGIGLAVNFFERVSADGDKSLVESLAAKLFSWAFGESVEMVLGRELEEGEFEEYRKRAEGITKKYMMDLKDLSIFYKDIQ